MYVYHTPNYFSQRLTIVGEFENDSTLRISAAICSTKDNFCRKTGRELAEKRMKEGKHVLTVHNLNKSRFKTSNFIKIAERIDDVIAIIKNVKE